MFQFLKNHTHFPEWIRIPSLCHYDHSIAHLCSHNRSLSKLQYLDRKPHSPHTRHTALAGFHAGSLSWSNWNLESWLLWREENRRIRRKTFGARREPTTNSTHIWHRAEIEAGQHWWERARALTTASSLLPKGRGRTYPSSPIRFAKLHVQWLKPTKYLHKWLYGLPTINQQPLLFIFPS